MSQRKSIRSIFSREALENGISHAALGLIPIVQKLPDAVTDPFGRALGAIAYHCWGRVRSVALDNLRHAFPDWNEDAIRKMAQSTFRNWGSFLVEFLRLTHYTPQDWENRVVIEGRAHGEAALERGHGLIIYTGHIGCFELGAAFAAYQKVPTSVIVRYAKTAKITQRLTELRENAGYRVLAYDARGFRALKALRNNEIVCILIDQDAGRSGVFVNFFGRPASTPPGPAVLAARTGAALVPGFVIREGPGRYRIILEPEVPNPGRDATPEQILATTQAMSDRLEAIVRRYPDQWLWMHRRWKTQPAPAVPENQQ